MDETPAPRMMDDPSLAPELRAAVRTYAGSGVGLDYDAGLLALRARLGGGGGGGGRAPTSRGLRTSAATVAVGAVVAVIWWASTTAPTDTSAPAASPPVTPAVVEPVIAAAPVATTVATAPPDVPVVEPRAPAVTDEESAPRAASARRPGESLLALEMRLVAEARRSVDASPRRALSALDSADHEVGPGTFDEERAALRVLALRSLGRGDDARRLGRTFLAAHPDGLFSSRVRAIVDEQE